MKSKTKEQIKMSKGVISYYGKKDNHVGCLFFAWRHGPESNWRITVLQTIAFPLSNRAKTKISYYIQKCMTLATTISPRLFKELKLVKAVECGYNMAWHKLLTEKH